MSILSNRSLAGGEIGPELHGRCDVQKFATALRTQRNIIGMRCGGVMSRNGTAFVAEAKDSTKRVRLIPFIFSASQAYMLEFGDYYLRVIKNGTYVYEAAKNITAITQANPGVLTSNAHGYSNGQEIYISGIVGMTQLNGKNYRVAGVTTNTYTLQNLDGTAVNTTAYTAYSSGGTSERVYTLTTLFGQNDLPLVKFTQNKDVMVFKLDGVYPQKLSRISDANWTIGDFTFASSQQGPQLPLSVSQVGTAGSKTVNYYVDAIGANGLKSAARLAGTTTSNATLNDTNYNVITWGAATGAVAYNVYKEKPGSDRYCGFIGSTTGVSFADQGTTPDYLTQPQIGSDSPGGEAVAFAKQRLIFGGGSTKPETIAASVVGNYGVFPTVSPVINVQASDKVELTIVGRRLNQIFHIISLGGLVIFTSDGEWALRGGLAADTIPDIEQQSYNGSSRRVVPQIINNRAIYVQARGNVVRELAYNFETEGYGGEDLTVFAPHFFDGYEILEMAYQAVPHSIIWAIRDDGVLIAMTYNKEQQIWGWHRHDTGRLRGDVDANGNDLGQGYFESVAVIPEGLEDVVYVVVRRYINGRTVRYIERLSLEETGNIVEDKIMDSHLTFDGRNIGINMTLSGGTTWDEEYLTLTAGSAFFKSTDVGNAIHLNYYEFDTDLGRSVLKQIRCEIMAYTSSTVVTVLPSSAIPVSLQNVANVNNDYAVDEISGLDHLEGEFISVVGDGYVVGSPNNVAYTLYTVENGKVTLDRPYSVIHAGLPMLQDLESLDIDTANGETLADKNKLVSEIVTRVVASRGFFVGGKPPTSDTSDPLEGLSEQMVRSDDDDPSLPVQPVTGILETTIDSAQWNNNGRVFIRNVDPVRMKIVSIHPAGMFPFRGG